MENERSHKEVAQLVEKTVAEIKQGKITDEVIQDTCKKYGIDEFYIRRVMGWDGRNRKQSEK